MESPTLSAFYRETWFTVEGARLKRRRLFSRGLPDFTNWRFITLTVDNRTADPVSVFLKGKDRLRRFTAKFRECIGRDFRWAWKLELHEDGYPHWHMLVDYTRKIPVEFLEEVASWWGLGRVNIRRVKQRDLHYVFKYVSKGGESIPDWVLDYKGVIRCFQTSPGFFPRESISARAHTEPVKCMLRVPLRTLLKWDERKAIVVEYSQTGNRMVSVVRLQTSFATLLMSRVNFALRHRVPLPDATTLHPGQFTLGLIKYEHSKNRGVGLLPAGGSCQYLGE